MVGDFEAFQDCQKVMGLCCRLRGYGENIGLVKKLAVRVLT